MTVRPPAVAGSFYTADPDQLARTVDDALSHCRREAPVDAVIAPHAGYVFSGDLAAVAHAQLRRDGVTRVAIVGPSHRVGYQGIAVPEATHWATPLGEIAVDVPDAVRALPGVFADDRVMADEHSLEVHVPFIQRGFPGASIAPLQVGQADGPTVGAAISALLADPGTVVVVSSDLSHYLPDEAARRVDRDTLGMIQQLRGPIASERACGAGPINGLIDHARRTGQQLEPLLYANSGDTAGDKERVVGYGVVALYPAGRATQAEVQAAERESAGSSSGGRTVDATDTTDPAAGTSQPIPAKAPDVLLTLARNALNEATGRPTRDLPRPPAWSETHGATFVTLRLDGRLRGCIGSLRPYRPLAVDVVENTRLAALHDTRFEPVTAEEVPRILIEVSLLNQPVEVPVCSEEEAVAHLRGLLDRGRKEGVILVAGDRRATLLPQVWDTIPDPTEFVRQLVQKAGLRGWEPGTRLFTYGVTAWAELPPE